MSTCLAQKIRARRFLWMAIHIAVDGVTGHNHTLLVQLAIGGLLSGIADAGVAPAPAAAAGAGAAVS